MRKNRRLDNIQEYHFKRIDELKCRLEKEGRRIYDFGVGDPDLPINKDIVQALCKATEMVNFNKYPPYDGIVDLKIQIVNYYREVFGVELGLDEVVVLIGSKEGLSNIIPAVCDFGDTAIIPVPSYPVYGICAKLWGVKTYNLPLRVEAGYLPELEFVPEAVVENSKLFIINYPNNPTGAVADGNFFRYIKSFCAKNDIVLCNDAAYNEIIGAEESPSSILQGEERRNCIEFGTLSKTFNMTGFRIGYAVGDAEVIRALLKIKTNVDSGQFLPVQYAAVNALCSSRDSIISNRRIYSERRETIEALLQQKRIDFFQTKGTFYVWCSVPQGFSTARFCEEFINKYGIILTPGDAFGEGGEDHFRIALTKNVEIIKEAFDKIEVYN
jgi:LL-diaminopimelate aminotransferase